MTTPTAQTLGVLAESEQAERDRQDRQRSVLEDELTELREEYANTVARVAELQVALDDVSKLTSTWFHRAEAAEARVAELEAERHTTNEALDDAVKAIRDANTAAGLVAEYHLPAADGGWLAVRREPKGDRWAIYTAGRVLGDRKTWTGELWISIALATDSELWNYTSADAALAEATRLAETTEAVAR
jgi:hypothetical protein